MNVKDPKLIALQFNEYINNQDISGLTNLMTEDHTFIDREGKVDEGKESMTQGWITFFNQFPNYKNYFTMVESRDNLVILLGYAKWTTESKTDYAIWTAKIKNDRVAEWRIFHDTEEKRKKLKII
ncbi:MAG: nuclear transport factor 2 family protein [Candidatus Hodarchaeota archaeon]